MQIKFADTTYECRSLHLTTGRFKRGDLLLYGDIIVRVDTVQPDCIGWNKGYYGYGNERFTMLVVSTATGREFGIRNCPATLVWRPKKKVS